MLTGFNSTDGGGLWQLERPLGWQYLGRSGPLEWPERVCPLESENGVFESCAGSRHLPMGRDVDGDHCSGGLLCHWSMKGSVTFLNLLFICLLASFGSYHFVWQCLGQYSYGLKIYMAETARSIWTWLGVGQPCDSRGLSDRFSA